ncbi:MAG: DUF1223 domain-containing protein [Bacteroidota bacterium]
MSNSFAVVELFTSEGCNTCPPADKLLSEIIADARKNKKPIYAMEFHVDIWNRLGWKDPYSSFKFTYRQKNYTDALGEMEVYTPQVFINGNKPLVGSDKKRMLSEIDKELKTPSEIILKITKNNLSTADTLLIDYESSKTDKNMNLYVALVQRGLVSKIGKGENSGKTLTHDNVVRVFENTPLITEKGTIKIPVSKFKLYGNFSLYGFVQQKLNKKILAATGFDFP